MAAKIKPEHLKLDATKKQQPELMEKLNPVPVF